MAELVFRVRDQGRTDLQKLIKRTSRLKVSSKRIQSHYVNKTVIPLLKQALLSELKANINSLHKGDANMLKGVRAIVSGSFPVKVLGVEMRGTAAKYALIKDRGGVMRARNHKWMTIPIGVNRDASGHKKIAMPQLPDKSFFTKFYADDSDENYGIVFRKKPYIAGANARNLNRNNIEPIFKLVKRLRVVGTNWATSAVRKTAQVHLKAIVKQTISQHNDLIIQVFHKD